MRSYGFLTIVIILTSRSIRLCFIKSDYVKCCKDEVYSFLPLSYNDSVFKGILLVEKYFSTDVPPVFGM